MSYLDYIEDDTVLVIPSSIKEEVITTVTKEKPLTNIKYISLEELRRKVIFDYDEKAIFYLMNKYNIKYDVAKIYLDNIVYVKGSEIKDEKITKLLDIQKEIVDNKLNVTSLYNEYKNKKIIVYGYHFISEFDKRMLEKLSDDINIVSILKPKYKHKNIYEFKTIKDEVEYVFEHIADLINKGIDINNIKIMGLTNDYYGIMKRYSEIYNIPVSLPSEGSIYSTEIVNYFLENINDDSVFDNIKNKFDNNEDNVDIINKLINICNKYVWANNLLEVKELIIHDMKNTNIKTKELKNSVKLISFDNEVDDDNYIFILGFNYGSIPTIYKDEEYLSDKLKLGLGLMTSTIKNKMEKEYIISKINNIKNLIITYKLSNNTESYTISNLNDELKLEIIKEDNLFYVYSDKANKIKLASNIDKLVKFGVKDKDLSLLYNNYKDINYLKYSNEYKNIEKEEFTKYIKNELSLSYTSMDNYFKCGFRYYLNNILKLNPYEETFMTILGTLFHEVLSKAFTEEFDLDKEYNNFLEKQTYEFSNKELYFIKKAKEDLKFVIETIKKQYKYTSLNKAMYEEKVCVDKSGTVKVTFNGIIDKVLYEEKGNNTIVCIIDYKTGNPDININNAIYGLGLQLPVYLYLSKNMEKISNVEIAGFYLQKILNKEIVKDYKHTYTSLLEDGLKLQGYSNDNTEILRELDDSYDNSNMIKSLKTTKTGFYSYSKVINNEQIDSLINLVDKKIEEARDNILDVSFDINPKKIGKENIGCKYCNFNDICYMEQKDIVELKEYKNAEFLGGETDA